MDPATWIYLAIMAAAAATSAKAQHKTNKERAKVAAEERDRRKEQQKESEAAALKTQEAYFNQRDKAAAREAELASAFEAGEAPAPTTDAAGTRFLDIAAPTSSTQTIEGAQSEMAKGRARASQRATSIAQLGAFGDVMQDTGLDAARNAQDIGISASKMRGWQQNVLPALYNKANVAGRDWATTSDILKLVGAVYGGAALGGAGAADGAGEVTSNSIQAARFGDTAKLAQGFGAGGAVPFGSTYGLDAANAALASVGSTATAAAAGSELVGTEGLSRALWKQLNGYQLTEAERRALLMKQMAGGM
jgi:hypothetical protein